MSPPDPALAPDPAAAPESAAAPGADRVTPLSATAYDVAGPPGAAAIVFLHGTRLCRTAWTAQAQALSDAFRVVTLDLPGHGALAGERFTLPAARERVVRTIEEVAGDRAVLVGLSLGGYVAMDVAAARPDRVRGLVLTGATAEPTGVRMWPYLALAGVMGRYPGERLRAIDARIFRARFPSAIAEPIVAGGFWPVGGAEGLRAIAGERFAPRLAAYPGPTLILNGAQDLPFRFFSASFARAARHARRVRIAGASHLANLDRPDAYSLAIRRFMASLPAEGRTGPARVRW